MINTYIEQQLKESILCWLATVDKDGAPNVSPKEIFAVWAGTHLLIANIASPSSVRNIDDNPAVCVSSINIFKQKGYKFKGLAENLYPSDSGYNDRHAALALLAGPEFPIKSIIEVKVTEVVPILAPSYILHPDKTESAHIENALKTYGVSKIR